MVARKRKAKPRKGSKPLPFARNAKGSGGERFWFQGVRYNCRDKNLVAEMTDMLRAAASDAKGKKMLAARIACIKRQYTGGYGGARRGAAPPSKTATTLQSPCAIQPSAATLRELDTGRGDGPLRDDLDAPRLPTAAPTEDGPDGPRLPLAARPLVKRPLVFEVVRSLGEGVFGQVFKAILKPPFPFLYEKEKALASGKRLPEVAVKVVSKSAADSARASQEREEMRILKKLKGHIHVARLLSWVETAFNFQMVFNVAHCDLLCFLRKRPMAADEGKTLCSQMLSALT